MNKIKILLNVVLGFMTWHTTIAQDSKPINPGSFGLALRTTASVFLGDNASGFGSGAHFKILFAKRVNSEWFFDYLNSSAGRNGYRKDAHFGWTVQFALNKGGYQTLKPVPFIEAGQCFDWTTVGFKPRPDSENSIPVSPWETGPVFSIATAAGTGLSWFPVSRLEVEAHCQYMIHLTRDMHLEFDESDIAWKIEEVKGSSYEGHLLASLSLTWYIIQPTRRP